VSVLSLTLQFRCLGVSLLGWCFRPRRSRGAGPAADVAGGFAAVISVAVAAVSNGLLIAAEALAASASPCLHLRLLNHFISCK